MEFNKNVEKLLKKLNAEFDPEIIPVKIEDFAQLHHCYSNVEQKVKNDGGQIFYGWIIHETNILCEAEHHAVWMDKEENLIDITPNQTNSEEILFLPDNNFTYNGVDVDNVRINITNNYMVDDFIFISEYISKLYGLGERIDDEQITLPVQVSKLIYECQIIQARLLQFIENKTNKLSNCICGANKSYKNCCHKILKSTTEKQFQDVKNLII